MLRNLQSPRLRHKLRGLERHRPTVSQCVNPIKLFVYGWNVLLIVTGLGILIMDLYFLLLVQESSAIPTLVFKVGGYSGAALCVVSALGLVGLNRQRICVTKGERNYSLALVRNRYAHPPPLHGMEQ